MTSASKAVPTPHPFTQVGVHSIKRYDLLLRLERVPRAERTSQRTPRELDSFNSLPVSLVSFSGRSSAPAPQRLGNPNRSSFLSSCNRISRRNSDQVLPDSGRSPSVGRTQTIMIRISNRTDLWDW